MENEPFEKIVQPTSTGKNVAIPVFVKIKFDGKRLSITGVEGPTKNGNCYGGCGQIKLNPRKAAYGWTPNLVQSLVDVWEEWHLNDMRAGCLHQRALMWDKLPINSELPTDTYGNHLGEGKPPTWNMLVWVSRQEHPKGLLSVPCDECGYKYGTAWLFEEIPAEVLIFLRSLPDSPIKPAWC
jgi:hypothetical protein